MNIFISDSVTLTDAKLWPDPDESLICTYSFILLINKLTNELIIRKVNQLCIERHTNAQTEYMYIHVYSTKIRL